MAWQLVGRGGYRADAIVGRATGTRGGSPAKEFYFSRRGGQGRDRRGAQQQRQRNAGDLRRASQRIIIFRRSGRRQTAARAIYRRLRREEPAGHQRGGEDSNYRQTRLAVSDPGGEKRRRLGV